MTSIVIVGAGTAAYTCARELRKLDKQVALTLVSQDAADVYSKPMLSNALAKQLSPAGLVTSTAEHVANTLDATIINHTPVQRIDLANKHLHTADSTIKYDLLVLAVGASQRDPGLDNPQQVALQQINHIDDYINFRHALADAKHVIIVGAGLIGCEFANDLVAAGYACTVVSPGSHPLSHLLPTEAASFFMQKLSAAGVQWRMNAKARGVEKSANGVSVSLANSTEVQGDLILSAVGLKPNVSLASAAGLKCQRGIVVNEYLQSSEPNIFALGDCAEVNGQVLPFILPIMHGARALASTLSGSPSTVTYPLMPVVVKTPACPLVILAAPSGSQGEWEYTPQDDGLTAIFRDKLGHIQGFALLGSAIAQRQQILKQMSQ